MFSLCVCVEALCACSGTRGSEFIASALSLIHSKASLILVYTLFSCFTIHALQITMALTANINFTQHNHAEPSSLLISSLHPSTPPFYTYPSPSPPSPSSLHPSTPPFTPTHHPRTPHPNPSTLHPSLLHPPVTLTPLHPSPSSLHPSSSCSP